MFPDPGTLSGVWSASFVLTFFGTFVPMLKVDFGPPAQGVAAQKASALVAQELIQQVPQIQVAPQDDMSVLDDDDPETELEIKAKQPEEKPKVVERTADRPQHLKDASGWLLSCMTEGIKSIPDTMKGLDAFNRFGLTLFFAGAGDFVGTRYRCDQNQRSDMLTERMQLLGHDENTAFAFCANIDEYLMQPKYLKMYDLGRTAMKNFLENQKADLKLEGAVRTGISPPARRKRKMRPISLLCYSPTLSIQPLKHKRSATKARWRLSARTIRLSAKP